MKKNLTEELVFLWKVFPHVEQFFSSGQFGNEALKNSYEGCSVLPFFKRGALKQSLVEQSLGSRRNNCGDS